jgi:putative tricarboxylic transport membrane protein
LIKLVREATNTSSWKATLDRMGWTPVFLPGDEFSTFVADESNRIASIFEALALKR